MRTQPIRAITLVIALGALCTLVYLSAIENPAIAIKNNDATITKTSPIHSRSKSDTPTFITIDKLGISTSILPVGVDTKGAFSVPSAESVGWYKFGSSLEDRGSTVLAGHVDYDDKEGVFFDLKKLAPGDTIIVETRSSSVSYEVQTVKNYTKEGVPRNELFRRTGPRILTLITCGGQFDAATRSYTDNLVVIATPHQ